jgi:galactoside O-acetyltransferase
MKPWRVIRGLPNLVWQNLIASVRVNESRAAAELRRWIYRTECHVDSMVHVTNKRNLKCGEGCALYHAAYVLNGQGTFEMGRQSHLGAFCFVNVEHGSVKIGDHVAIGPGTKIIAYSNHYEAGRKVTDVRTTDSIVIGNNVFIGANCTLLPGTIVHDDVVIGAGSVVRGELQGNAIYAGVPCKEVRRGWHHAPTTA